MSDEVRQDKTQDISGQLGISPQCDAMGAWVGIGTVVRGLRVGIEEMAGEQLGGVELRLRRDRGW
jgi:hypothetical protein